MTPRRRPAGALAVGLVAALILAGLLVPGSSAGAARAGKLPPRKEWLADVRQAMKGSQPYVRERVAEAEAEANDGDADPAPRLAINFDVDNTVIATTYDGGGAIKRMLRFAKFADERGVALFFNSARLQGKRRMTLGQLKRAGYPVKQLCLRRRGERIPVSKQRCRQRFVDKGYTIIANVGNRPTDFEGGNYDRAFKLPNYGGRLS